MGRAVELPGYARPEEIGDILRWDGGHWVPDSERSAWSVGRTILSPVAAAVMEGPGIDVMTRAQGLRVGLGGDRILRYDSAGDPVAEHVATDAGLTEALAAATSGDIVVQPACTISGNHTVPAGVTLMGLDVRRSILTGQVTMGGDGAALAWLTVSRTGTTENTIGVVGQDSDTSYLYYCRVAVTTTSGIPICVYSAAGGVVEIYFADFFCQQDGVDMEPLAMAGLTSWHFNNGPQGWEAEVGDPPATCTWANSRLEVESPDGWTWGRWKYETPGMIANTGATFSGVAHHGGNCFMRIVILYTDETYDITLYESGFAQQTISVQVAAGNDGKEVQDIRWECWSIHHTSGVNWFDNAAISGFGTVAKGIKSFGAAGKLMTAEPLYGDRSAWQVDQYWDQHSNEDEACLLRHLPAPVAWSDIARVNSDGYWEILTGPDAEREVMISLGTPDFSFGWRQLVTADMPAGLGAYARGRVIVGGETDWTWLPHPGAAYHLQTDAQDVGWSQNVTMADGAWLGIPGNELLTVNAAGTFAFSGILGVRILGGTGNDAFLQIGSETALDEAMNVKFITSDNTLQFYGYNRVAGSGLNLKSSTGYVGIGVVPSVDLEIRSSTQSRIRIGESGAIYADYIWQQGATPKRLQIRTVGDDYPIVLGNNFIWIDTDTNNGKVIIGGMAPLAKLHVDQFSATGAIPVMLWDQADLSEEFLELTTTVGAGNPIDTAAIGAYYGKVRVKVTGVAGYKYVALYN